MKLQNLIIIFVIIAVIIIAASFDFTQTEKIKVGLLVNLSGSHSDVGIDIRDGVILAVDELNQADSFDDYQLELLVRDHEMDINKAIAAVKEFKEAGVEVIIGPGLSGIISGVIDTVNELDMIMLSPTSGSQDLISADNNLFRLVPDSEQEQELVVQNIINNIPEARVGFISDRSNSAFTKDWKQQLSEKLQSEGGELIETWSYDFTRLNNYKIPILNLYHKFDALVIAANPTDTAMLVQNYYNFTDGDVKPIYATRWSFDRALLKNGSKAVEGVILPHPWKYDYERYGDSEFYLSFNKYYNRRPDFGAYYGYEAVLVLKDLLDGGTNYQTEAIKNELQSSRNFKGIKEQISFNQYGDAARDIYLYQIEDGDFRRIEQP